MNPRLKSRLGVNPRLKSRLGCLSLKRLLPTTSRYVTDQPSRGFTPRLSPLSPLSPLSRLARLSRLSRLFSPLPPLALTALALACIAGAGWAQDTIPEPTVEIVFLDVGHGDAILIRSPEGEVALVDAGLAPIGDRLRALGVERVEVVIATHPSPNHIGGMADVFRSFPVRFYVDNGMTDTTAAYRELIRAIQQRFPRYLEPEDRSMRLGSVRLDVLAPPDSASTIGNRSVGLVVRFGEFRAFFAGDAELEEVEYFLAEKDVPEVQLLKAPNHGSRAAVSPASLTALKPQVVVIPVGPNDQGLPHRWALSYYESATRHNVYRTDLQGSVTVLGRRDGSFQVRSKE